MEIPGDIQNELINALTFAFPDKQKIKNDVEVKIKLQANNR